MPATRTTPHAVRHWCFTSFADADPIDAWDPATMNYLVRGKETCPDTGRAHWQCYVNFKTKIRLSNVKTIFGATVHAEQCRGNPEQNREYCIKEGDWAERGKVPRGERARNDIHEAVDAAVNGMSFEDLMVSEHSQVVARSMQYFRQLYSNMSRTAGRDAVRAAIPSDSQLRPWQSDLLAVVRSQPDPRTVYWRWDFTGNTGKSFFAKYLLAWHDAAIFTNGKLADMAYAYNNETIVIIDLARTQAESVNYFYQFIESLKNGVLFSPKYESGQKIFKPPHVIVFANFEPDQTKLSADRWNIVQLDSDRAP